MDKLDEQPFKVGQLAEAKSFVKGFRGAWFRCKIQEINQRKDHIRHALEFFDFPDDKVKWTKLYQLPLYGKKGKEMRRQLMVRPQYPPMYNESQIPPVDRITEVTVTVDGAWKVGDLVDWWTDGCYWTGRLSQILDNEKAQITLLQPPEGEGGEPYDVFCKDLRPSLDWSPEYGWRVPTSMEGDNCHSCARLIQPVKQAAVGLLNFDIHAMDEGINNVQDKAGSPVNASLSSHISANSLPVSDKSKRSKTREISGHPLRITVPKEVIQKPEGNDLDMGDSSIGKPSISDSVSSSHIKEASAETAGHTAGQDLYTPAGSLKKLKTGGSIPLNSLCSDSLDAAIFDLEELVNKTKYLKAILEFGSHDARPPWKFLEHRSSSTSK